MLTVSKATIPRGPSGSHLALEITQRHVCSASGLSSPIFEERSHIPHSSMKRTSKSCCKKNMWDGRCLCGCFWKTQAVTSHTCIVMCVESVGWCWLSVRVGNWPRTVASVTCVIYGSVSAQSVICLTSWVSRQINKKRWKTTYQKDQLFGAGSARQVEDSADNKCWLNWIRSSVQGALSLIIRCEKRPPLLFFFSSQANIHRTLVLYSSSSADWRLVSSTAEISNGGLQGTHLTQFVILSSHRHWD